MFTSITTSTKQARSRAVNKKRVHQFMDPFHVIKNENVRSCWLSKSPAALALGTATLIYEENNRSVILSQNFGFGFTIAVGSRNRETTIVYSIKMTTSSSVIIIGLCVTIGVLLFAQQTDAFRRIHSLSRHRQPKVNQSLTINMYYESLCPDCEEFISEKLCPLWKESIMSNYFRIEFVPYGNAETTISKTGEITFDCQHGPLECEANIIHACALKHLAYKDSVEFICCMESRRSAPGTGAVCADELELDYSQIDKCAKGSEGVNLHYLLGKQTDNLKPAHEYVPWILFNGQYNKEDMDHAQDDLLGIVCKYLKDPKPDACNEVY